MRGILAAAIVGVVVVACKAPDNRPIGGGGEHVDAPPPVDAVPDAKTCIDVMCDVTVTCALAVSHISVPLCLDGTEAKPFETAAKVAAMSEVDCTPGATFAATCTAARTAYKCDDGFELEDATVCIVGMHYDADTSDICSHPQVNAGACSVPCDRTALYPFATGGKYTKYFCMSTDGIHYQVGAAPMTGDGAR